MKELFGNNYIIIVGSNWNEFVVSIMNYWNVCLNVLITLPTVWNDSLDKVR